MISEAEIERLVKALVAAVAYEAQLEHVSESLSLARTGKQGTVAGSLAQAREALHAASAHALDMQHRLPGRGEVLAMMPGPLMRDLLRVESEVYQHGGTLEPVRDELVALVDKVANRARGLAKLRGELDAELTALRADVRGGAEPWRRITAADLAQAADDQARDEHAEAVRAVMRELN